MVRTLDTAVLLIVFNRPGTTAKVFEAIREAAPSRLYIASDAPRFGHPTDVAKNREVKQIVSRVDWPCEVKTQFQEENLGCSLGPRAAFSWFFQHEEEGIILEDDCVPHKSFFYFCAEMLDKYRDNHRIISVNGSNLGYNLNNGDSYTFSRFMNMWGWATWRRSAEAVDYELKDWKHQKQPLLTLYSRLRQNILDTDLHWYRYWKDKFDRTVNGGKVTWWDWQWIYHQTRNQQLSIVPSVNLVSNIGFHDDATHTKAGDNPAASIPAVAMQFPLQHPRSMSVDLNYEEEFVKWVWCYHRRQPASYHIKSYARRIAQRIFFSKL